MGKGEIRMKKWETVELLRHARHDWLNKIQLIQGYLSMGNPKRVHDLINEMVFECEQETKLSNLPLPELASFFLTYNFERHPVLLKYEVKGNGTVVGSLDGRIADWFRRFMEIMNKSVSDGEENELYITLDLKEGRIVFSVHFNGELCRTEPIEQFFSKTNLSFIVEDLKIRNGAVHFRLIV